MISISLYLIVENIVILYINNITIPNLLKKLDAKDLRPFKIMEKISKLVY